MKRCLLGMRSYTIVLCIMLSIGCESREEIPAVVMVDASGEWNQGKVKIDGSEDTFVSISLKDGVFDTRRGKRVEVFLHKVWDKDSRYISKDIPPFPKEFSPRALQVVVTPVFELELTWIPNVSHLRNFRDIIYKEKFDCRNIFILVPSADSEVDIKIFQKQFNQPLETRKTREGYKCFTGFVSSRHGEFRLGLTRYGRIMNRYSKAAISFDQLKEVFDSKTNSIVVIVYPDQNKMSYKILQEDMSLQDIVDGNFDFKKMENAGEVFYALESCDEFLTKDGRRLPDIRY